MMVLHRPITIETAPATRECAELFLSAPHVVDALVRQKHAASKRAREHQAARLHRMGGGCDRRCESAQHLSRLDAEPAQLAGGGGDERSLVIAGRQCYVTRK